MPDPEDTPEDAAAETDGTPLTESQRTRRESLSQPDEERDED